MRVKNLRARYRANPDTAVQIAVELVAQFPVEVRRRNLTTPKQAASLLNELDHTWRTFVRGTPLRPDGFSEVLARTHPSAYELWQRVKEARAVHA